MSNKHLTIGGSTIDRTLNCPGWIKLKEQYNPSNRSGTAADIGNLLHDAMEEYYLNDIEFEDQVGKTKFEGHVLEEDLLDLLYSARKMVEHCLDTYDIEEFLCEPFVRYVEDPTRIPTIVWDELSVSPGDIGGSIDMLGVSADGKTVVVIDYKFGKSKVQAEQLPQLLFYFLCAWCDPKTHDMIKEVEKIVLVIVQPKCSVDPDIYETNLTEIFNLEKEMIHALTKEHLKTGSWCYFCPCAPYCPEKRKDAVRAEVLSKKGVKNLGEAWELARELESWIEEVKKEVFSKLSAGARIPEVKLVEGNKTKEWTADAETLKKMFGKRVMKAPEPISPAQAIKLFGKEEVEPFYKEEAKKHRVAPASDKKEAIVIDVEENFNKFLLGEE